MGCTYLSLPLQQYSVPQRAHIFHISYHCKSTMFHVVQISFITTVTVHGVHISINYHSKSKVFNRVPCPFTMMPRVQCSTGCTSHFLHTSHTLSWFVLSNNRPICGITTFTITPSTHVMYNKASSTPYYSIIMEFC